MGENHPLASLSACNTACVMLNCCSSPFGTWNVDNELSVVLWLSVTVTSRQGRKRTGREATERTRLEEEREGAHFSRETTILP